MRQRKQRKRGAVVNYKGLRHDDVILGIHRYEVIGLSVGGLMADVAHLHGRRQGSSGQKQQRPFLRMAVAHYPLIKLLLTSVADGAHGAVHAAWPHSP